MGASGGFEDVADGLDRPSTPPEDLPLITSGKTDPQPNPLIVEGTFCIHEEQRRVIKQWGDQEFNQFGIIWQQG